MSMFIPSSLADRAMKTAIDDMVTKDTAWIDTPTAVVEDPLHPKGFDFRVDLKQQPATATGVAGFERDGA